MPKMKTSCPIHYDDCKNCYFYGSEGRCLYPTFEQAKQLADLESMREQGAKKVKKEKQSA